MGWLLELRIAPQTTVLLQADYLEDRRVTDFGSPAYKGRPVNVPASRYYGAANARGADYSQSRVYLGTATINHRFKDNWSIRNATRYYHYSLDRNNTLTNAVNESTQTLTMSLQRLPGGARPVQPDRPDAEGDDLRYQA